MRMPFLPIAIILIIGILVDCYIYKKIRKNISGNFWKYFYAVFSAILTVGLAVVVLWPKSRGADSSMGLIMWTTFTYFSFYVPKYVFVIFSLLQKLFSKIFRKRLRWITMTGASISVFLCALMWWGALITRYSLKVNDVDVPIKDLPAAFDGYRIVQISDIHTGTFLNDPSFLEKTVEKVNSLNPDIILFTGDIVNRHSAELSPFISTLGHLHAPDGVWSIMGNHDYGDYYKWDNPGEKKEDIKNLRSMQASMGWKMLNNDYTVLRRGNDSIILIGVENIGEPPFTTYGDLHASYPQLNDRAKKILMSHNPTHWTDSVSGHKDINIDLTLSGHTHAMQICLFGWSPASFRYKTWGGLYTDSLGRHLYVNTGLGEVGFPSRIGATPEITLITLSDANKN